MLSSFMMNPILLVGLAALRPAAAFYVPGVAPTDFKEGDRTEVRAVKMTSSQTQLPFEYYSLDFCKDKEYTPLEYSYLVIRPQLYILLSS